MRTIAIVSEHASPLCAVGGVDAGGQNIYVASVARELARLGLKVDVYTRRDSAALARVVDWLPGVRVVHVRAGPQAELPKEKLLAHMPAFSAAMHAFVREQKLCYDIVHANFFMSGWVGLRFARTFRTALVTTFHALGRVRRLHQGADDGFSDARFDIEDQLVRESHRIVAECPQDLRDMIEHYGADSSRIDIVPCGFDPAELQPIDRLAARAQLQWPNDEFTVLQLGRMVPRKGVDNVIRSIAVLKNRFGRDARLVIAGGNSSDPAMNRTPELERLARIAQDEGVADRVDFIGRCDRDRLRTVYSAADVFVTTPWYEPFGITPVEAMACGCPVVGAAVGGIQDTVVDGRTGYLVPPNDPVALAERLAQLEAQPALAQRMGRAGLARARKLYTWERVARALLDVYRTAASYARRPVRSPGRTGAAPSPVARLPLRAARAASASETRMGSNDAAAVGWK
ncbi:MAG: glycosyltransferase family 1 protein [Burkholderiaceae bacterium]|nr:glycosyltransferase family 1 protein [Burkholderiaceae bacterium]